MKAKTNLRTAAKAEVINMARAYLSLTDVPSVSLSSALRVAQAIVDNYAGGPVTAVQLAQALDMTPTSGPFRTLCGASIAFGLTSGGYNANQIAVEPLARRILRPLEMGDDLSAKREAFLKPRVITEFLNKYNNHAIPPNVIACNVLATMGVPVSRAEDVLGLIMEGAEALGLLVPIKDRKYVQLAEGAIAPEERELAETPSDTVSQILPASEGRSPVIHAAPALHVVTATANDTLAKGSERNNKVFVTHGKNKNFLEPIKQLLAFGKFEAVVSVERQSVSKPITDKVMDDMRTCSAAIIHVDAELQLLDEKGASHTVLNPNVLIEIGGALALYGKRFILLVKSSVALPSNLHGLYEVRYEGDSLSTGETIRLMQAIDEMSKV